ncbi:hypothetical protein DYB37_002570 [Aphanomyces astaci]|uniref:C2H2-type domain-containing protein n=1 Tax=Aphanomyces astaci TaxID=112090 RepID=A0A3R7BBI6_APHAT|nr:hypothetical protein DYB37_002570 [Aphanomyces astaci]
MGYLHQSQRVFTPLSQARLEHIDVVRLKKGGCRFEVACFKNKLVEWRRGIETNLSDVLQSEAIFDNVSRMSAIEQTMQKIHVALTPHEPVDIQALGVLQQLKQVMPIVRATMKVHVNVRHMQSTLESLGATILEQHGGANGVLECTCLIEPGVFGAVKAFVSEHATRRVLRVVECIPLDEDDVNLPKDPPVILQALEAPPVPVAVVVAPAASTRPCSTCGGHFADTAQYREHFRSTWHRYNLKMKAKLEPIVDEATFLALDAAAVQRPKGQKRLTNVAIVRLKKGGCRFEVACYKNKVVNWRNKIETQLDEVLQSHDVFVNVSKGKRATADDMRKVFGTDDVDEVAKLIIDLGELQVSDGERAAFNQSYVAVFHVLVEPFLPHERHTCSLFQEIATIVAEKCVNPESNRPYPRAMKEIHYSLIPNRSAKQQALEVISKLQDHMPITRAKMKVQVSVPAKDGKAMKKYLEQHNAAVLEQKGTSDVLRLICLIDPGAYRGLDAFVLNDGDNVDGSRSLEVLELSCHEEGEHSIDAEISKKTERLGLNADAPSVAPPLPSTTPSAAPAPVGRPCSTCGGAFVDTALYRQHFQSEWHRYNLKLKAKKRPVIDQAAFDTLSSHDVQRFFETLD